MRSRARLSGTMTMAKTNHALAPFLNPRSPLSSMNVCSMI